MNVLPATKKKPKAFQIWTDLNKKYQG